MADTDPVVPPTPVAGGDPNSHPHARRSPSSSPRTTTPQTPPADDDRSVDEITGRPRPILVDDGDFYRRDVHEVRGVGRRRPLINRAKLMRVANWIAGIAASIFVLLLLIYAVTLCVLKAKENATAAAAPVPVVVDTDAIILKVLARTQDEQGKKIAALEVQNTKLASDLGVQNTTLAEVLDGQNSKLSAALNSQNAKLDRIAGAVRSVQEAVASRPAVVERVVSEVKITPPPTPPTPVQDDTNPVFPGFTEGVNGAPVAGQ